MGAIPEPDADSRSDHHTHGPAGLARRLLDLDPNRIDEIVDQRVQKEFDRIEQRLRRAQTAREERDIRTLEHLEQRRQKTLADIEERVRRERERIEEQVRHAQAERDERARGAKNGRERIIEAAKSLFLDKGYVPVSMQQIAEAANLRKASIYHHFKDKEALFTQIVTDEFNRWLKEMQATAARDLPLPEALRELAEAQLQMTRTDTGRLFWDFQKFVPEERHEEIHAQLQQVSVICADLFERAMARGEIRRMDPRVAALFFFHMSAAWTFHGMEDPTLLPPDAASGAKTVVDVILNGLTGMPSREAGKPAADAEDPSSPIT